MASVSLSELHAYHRIDRDAFSRLVITLGRNPGESLLVMATWLWLEEIGYPNVINKMVSLADSLVNLLADEAISCLNCFQNQVLVSDVALPLTSKIMEREISMEIFQQNRFQAISGIKNILNTVCARIFTDILKCVSETSSVSSPGIFKHQPVVVPGFPHPVFGAITIEPRAMENDFPTGGLWGWSSTNNASEDDRTMFLTFSRGFPVTRDEVKEVFTKIYGDCVEIVHMQDGVPSAEQPLFARLVLKSVAAVDRILAGKHIAKFRINGKHIWARKYERRE